MYSGENFQDCISCNATKETQAKIISLFGPTNPNEWAPKGKSQMFVKSKTSNVNDITVDDVYSKAELFLVKTNGDTK